VVPKYAEELLPGTDVRWQYSPESFTGTELDYALEVCEAVMDVWQPTPERPVVLNLPATVEMSVPSTYADQVEWFGRAWASALERRPQPAPAQRPRARRWPPPSSASWPAPTASRGACSATASAPATSAWSPRPQPVQPGRRPVHRLRDIDEVRAPSSTATSCRAPAPPVRRRPRLHAFSGSHQDAIKKGFEALERDAARPGVPSSSSLGRAVPADRPARRRPQLRGGHPGELQSGKGGVAYVLKNEHHLDLPRRMQIEFSRVVQEVADDAGGEISPARIWELFGRTYLQHDARCGWLSSPATRRRDRIEARSCGRGARAPSAARATARSRRSCTRCRTSTSTSASSTTPSTRPAPGEEAQAASYLEVAVDGRVLWGCGVHPSIVTSSLRAIVSAVNRGSSMRETAVSPR
jgi:2-isopropylmalate synthase